MTRRNKPIAFFAMFVVALLPALNITVFGASNIYLTNIDEFGVGYQTLLLIYLPLGIVLAAVLATFGLLFRGVACTVYVSLLFVFGILLWLQGAFLMPDYGSLDGRGMDWAAIQFPVWADVLLWVVVLAAAVVLAGRIVRIAVFGSMVFVVLQATMLTAAMLEQEEGFWVRKLPTASAPPEAIYQYSPTTNIIHIVFDNFQTDVFSDLVAEQGLADEFDGFVLFRENTAVAPNTALAMPAIFSGRTYDGSVSPEDFYRQGMEEGFHSVLLDHDYTVNLMPLMSMRQGGYDNYYRLPRIYQGTALDQIRKDATQLLDLSVFRQIPHLARVWVYNNNNWRLSMWLNDPETVLAFQHRRFFTDYIDRLSTDADGPAYHFVHLWPPHPPFTTNRSGRYAGRVLENTIENYVNEARPIVALMVDLIHRLKDLGIYDDSLIIFQSDHGGGFEPDFMPTRLLGLLAVKPVGSRGPLEVSDVPTTVADVARTILDEMDISEPDFPGQSVLHMGSEQRFREFIYLGSGESRTLNRIGIQGSAYEPESYTRGDAVVLARPSKTYHYGDLVNVGLTGEGGRYLDAGWSQQADRHCWSNASKAVLSMTVEPPTADLVLAFDLIPHVHPQALPQQRVEIVVNGQNAGDWVGTEQRKQRMEVEVPKAWIEGSDLEIIFHLPDAVSPVELGTGGDGSQLGIALINILVSEVPSEQDH